VPTERHADVLGSLILTYGLRGNLVSDGELAALAIEHGLVLASHDAGFRRFDGLRTVDPLV
jgi:predicted nucleic acid-binding protein